MNNTEPSQAWHQGCKAYYEGAALFHNIYSRSQVDFCDWRDGWRYAEASSKA